MIDVLVIGAGPTGLLMAAEAARFGLSCRIIDKNSAPADQSRALAIQPRTLEIFDHLGIADRFLSKGVKVHGANLFSYHRQLAHFSFDALDSPYPFILSLEQSETEKILTDYLFSFGVNIEREVELIDLKQEEDRAIAFAQGQRIEAKWVVGCDGAHSATRKLLRFPFEGKAFPSAFSLADIALQWDDPKDEFSVFLNPEGILAAIPMPGKNRFRLVFQLASPLEREPTLADVQEKVNQAIGRSAVVSNPTWMANFHIHSRLVKSYRKGRVFLAGDAAHIHSPVGGQGMNSGLQDVFNLGWKLAPSHKSFERFDPSFPAQLCARARQLDASCQPAPRFVEQKNLGANPFKNFYGRVLTPDQEELLDTYTLERRSWGKSLVRATQFLTHLATLRNPAAVFLRNWFIQKGALRLEKYLIQAIGQIGIRYPKSAIVREAGSFDNGPRAGTRVPNAPIGNTDLYAILRKSTLPHLLFFGSESRPSRGVISLAVQDKRALKIFGIKSPSVYLIRPDQIIGYRDLN